MYSIQPVITKAHVTKVGQFLTSTDAFDQTWAPKEKAIVKRALQDSLINPHRQFWFVESDHQIIGAAGINENRCDSHGYEICIDCFSVHQKHQSQEVERRLIQTLEAYVKSQAGRYIHMVCRDTDSYRPIRFLFETFGYHQVGHIPDYFVSGEGRVDYKKEMLD